MFWSKNKKNRNTCITQFFCIKVGNEGEFISWTCFPDVKIKVNFGIIGCCMLKSENSGLFEQFTFMLAAYDSEISL